MEPFELDMLMFDERVRETLLIVIDGLIPGLELNEFELAHI